MSGVERRVRSRVLTPMPMALCQLRIRQIERGIIRDPPRTLHAGSQTDQGLTL